MRKIIFACTWFLLRRRTRWCSRALCVVATCGGGFRFCLSGSIFSRGPSSADVVEVSEEVVKVVVKVFEMLARSQFSAELRAGLVVAPPSAVLLRPTMEEINHWIMWSNLFALGLEDGRFWTYLSFSSIFCFQMKKSLRTSVRRWGHCLKKKCFLKAGKVAVDRKYNWGPICYGFPQVLVFLPPSQKQEYAWHSVSSGALWVFPHKRETSLCNT